jgi:hypothetical protein
MNSEDTRNSPENSQTEPATNSDGVSRRDFFGKVAAAGAVTYLAAQGADSAHAQQAGFKPILLQQQLPPVSPTLKLSANALQAPFKPGLKWLPDVRSFLTRTNNWVNLPTYVLPEVYVNLPAVNVVGVEGAIIWESSLGFGDISVMTDSFSCTDNNCEDQGVIGTCSGGQDSCNNQWCGDQYCSLDSCDKNSCSSQKCEGFDCKKNVSGFTSFVSEIESSWSHPFVQELVTYFQISTFDGLTRAVQHYIGRNMYDASAVRPR